MDTKKLPEGLTEGEAALFKTAQGFEFDVTSLFNLAYTRLGMQRQGRLQGKHCQSRLNKAKGKREKHKRKMKSFTP
jgi:hypothetical protein